MSSNSHRRVPNPDGPFWYHVQDLPGLGTVGEAGEGWDFREPGNADAYLGGVTVEGKRVLEVGPGSGFWTAAARASRRDGTGARDRR